MAFFTGEYDCKLDAKGRMVLPAKIKNALPEGSGDELVVRRGFEPCLVLYPMLEYKKIFSKIAGLNEFNAEYRNLQRNFFRGNAIVELDSAGRILIPKNMMAFAGLEKESIVVGMGNRVEIWDASKYDDYLIKDQQEFSDLAEKHLFES
ncbi:division/cell wall cluster transcriptional repressor MraZ [Marivirga tractuosa]|uniref:Transcriptional regulator MraZ n=1 Tax=Marivirga tractuosa (strain ATCC 23168 / DSM 4126 / NBRC 15989 / NCIMB 1408 / VKM B-1430 / H-43) TaxID=643867 RepID=E4TW41_MARTH|nr:division/cell wall cluster transcriptional repressor MraZ [Marivirga tractuosa]ADR23259.1 MraZ protein [Marivirga tractuosa DSM 4126]BDD16067.1 division/cell wall cluster transcriptional repressor MraZ [Marivirga tractuosa]